MSLLKFSEFKLKTNKNNNFQENNNIILTKHN